MPEVKKIQDPVSEIREMLQQEHSKKQCDRIVEYIGEDKKRMEALVHLFLVSHYRIVQRAAWPLGIIGERKPALMLPHISMLYATLKKPGIHDAVKRNVLRATQFMDLPERYWSEVLDVSFSLLQNRDEAIAIRVFAMTNIFTIGKKEKEFWRELKLILEEEIPYSGPAFRNRASRFLQQINREFPDM